jgi:hypothetical protein
LSGARKPALEHSQVRDALPERLQFLLEPVPVPVLYLGIVTVSG